MPRLKKSRQQGNGYRPPAVVSDFSALDDALNAFIVEKRVASNTRSTLEGCWRLWERHCEEQKVDPLDAPWAAWQELERLRRDDGRSYANGQLTSAILNAVEHHCRENGVTVVPAPRRPEHAHAWQAVRREWTTVTAEARGRRTPDGESSEVELRKVVPLMREDVLALLAAPLDAPCWPRGSRRAFVQERAQLLVALDTQAPARQLEAVSLSDIAARGDGSVAFGDFDLPCDHRDRVRGVPWDCSACAVLDALAARPDDGPETSFVLGCGPDASDPQRRRSRARFRGGLARVRGRWRGLESPPARETRSSAASLVPRADLTARELAGLRRGLVVAEAGPKSGAWLVGRPWVGVAWAAGFRMNSDLAGLPRSAARELITGEPGVLLRLAATKTDQRGLKPVKRPFTFEHQPAITQALVEYLAVRDAAVGDDPDGPLFIAAPQARPAKFIANPRNVATAFLGALTHAAGLKKSFVPYSTRKGYVAQAEADGWDPERTQAGLRHARQETTLAHYRESAPKVAAQKFINKASEGSP